MKKIAFFTSAILVFSLGLMAQVPAPAAAQKGVMVLTGSTLHVGDGQVIEDAILMVEKGKFTLVSSKNKSAVPKGANFNYVDVSGKHIYPGLIALNTTIGLTEVDAVRATRDFREVGYMNPSIRSIIAYNTDSDVTPTVKSNGVLMAQIVPQGGRISGQSSLVQLDAWNWEDAALATDIGIHLRWPRTSSWNWSARKSKPNEKYEEQVLEIEHYLKEAKVYTAANSPAITNLKFEAMKGLFDGSKKLFIHTNTAQTIKRAVLLAKNNNLKPVIVGGQEAWMITDFLKTNDIAVVLGASQSLPQKSHSDIDQSYKSPSILEKAGILFAISESGGWKQRNLVFQAGQAAAFGLGKENAIKAITQNPAKILGVEKQLGTITEGLDATFIVSEGDVLDMRTSRVTEAYIQGRKVSVDDKQKALYRKFQEKYKGE